MIGSGISRGEADAALWVPPAMEGSFVLPAPYDARSVKLPCFRKLSMAGYETLLSLSVMVSLPVTSLGKEVVTNVSRRSNVD